MEHMADPPETAFRRSAVDFHLPDGRWRPLRGSAAPILSLLDRGEWTLLQAGEERATYRVETPEGRFFVKHYRPTRFRARVRDFVRRRKPQRAFSLGRRLRERGIFTPDPLGLFVRGRAPYQEAVLVNAWLGEVRGWRRYLLEEAPLSNNPQIFRQAVAEMGRLLGRLHRQGFYHGDLRANLLFADAGKGYRPCLIDLEDLRRPLSRRRRVKNLGELERTIRERGRLPLRELWLFLKAYAGDAGFEIAEARRLWREVRKAQLRKAGGVEA